MQQQQQQQPGRWRPAINDAQSRHAAHSFGSVHTTGKRPVDAAIALCLLSSQPTTSTVVV